MALKLALKAIARLGRIDMASAKRIKRQNPLLETEIHIEEELLNLQESLDTYHTAGDTLRSYPTMQSHFLREKESILQHCVGLVARMLGGRKLPYSYTAKDADRAVRRLIQLLVEDARRSGRRIDNDIMEIFVPFMTVRQRVKMRQWGMDLVVQASQLPKVYDFGNMMLRRVRQ
ncbi:MAG TPA: hypothetical protein VF575_00125 [Candidatus Saccharimonadales bacterium]|jgi:hypothetical protein